LANHYERALHRQYPQAEVLIAHAGPALGTHCGPGGGVIATLDAAIVERAIQQEIGT